MLFGPCRGHCDLALAVEVRRETTLIPGLLFRSGEDQRDHELAGRVRQILGLLLRRGGDHCDLALAVGARRRPLHELAVELRWRRRWMRRRRSRRRPADIKSRNFHLTGGEKMVLSLHGVSISLRFLLCGIVNSTKSFRATNQLDPVGSHFTFPRHHV